MKHIKKFNEEFGFTGLLTFFAATSVLTELLGIFAHKLRVSTNKNRNIEDIVTLLGSNVKLELSDKMIKVQDTKTRHKSIITIDLNGKSAKVDVNYKGIFNLNDMNKFPLNNSDIYNICYVLSKNNKDRIDYDKDSNVFYTRFKPSNF